MMDPCSSHAESTFDDNLGLCETIFLLLPANNPTAVAPGVCLGGVPESEPAAAGDVLVDADSVPVLAQLELVPVPSHGGAVVVEAAGQHQLLVLLPAVLLGQQLGEVVVGRSF